MNIKKRKKKRREKIVIAMKVTQVLMGLLNKSLSFQKTIS